ncbi:MAG TPA: GYF domain-containing protein, partial [Chthoniobacteraceae bacterium]
MTAEDTQNWYLLKNDDGTIFGPVPFSQLRQWAAEAQVSPLDKVSTDEQNWLRAPMVPGLEMDYLIEVSPDQYYGPTNFG